MSADLDTLPARPHPGAGATQVELEELPKWRRRLRLVIPGERVRRERQRLVAQYGKRVRIPGFRPGKAPVDIVLKRFRSEIEDELIRSLLQAGVREAIEERNLQPISPPEVRSAELDEGEAFRAMVEVEVQPEIALARYRGFRIERPPAAVPPGAAERVLERLREERAQARPVERPAARGDVVLVDGMPLGGGGREIEGHELLLGSGLSPQVETQLEGARAGDERTVTVQPPQPGEGVPEAAPSDAAAAPGPVPASSPEPIQRWVLRVREVRERVLPDLDDEFAASISRSRTVAELRAQIAENLRQEAEARQEEEVRERLIEAIAEANAIEVPESMISNAVQRMLHPERQEHDAEHAHHTRRERWSGKEEEVAEILRPAAERSLRRLLIVDAVAGAEGLEPSEAQVDAYIGERVEPGKSVEEARHALERTGRLDNLRHHLRTENVFEYLKSQSTLSPVNERSPVEPPR